MPFFIPNFYCIPENMYQGIAIYILFRKNIFFNCLCGYRPTDEIEK